MRGFSVSVSAVLFLSAAYFAGAGQFLLLMFIAAAVHELGHFAALRLCGGRVMAMRLELTGFVMHGVGLKSYTGELITAAAGPFASAALAVLAAFAARSLDYATAYSLAGMSLIFCLFNLLPVLPLDGGRILYNASARFFGLRTAERITCAAGCAALLVALCAGAYVLVVTKTNFTLIAGAVWLLVYYCKNGNNSII